MCAFNITLSGSNHEHDDVVVGIGMPANINGLLTIKSFYY